MVFSTPVAFFISHYFLLIRRRLLAELIFTGFLTLYLTINYGALYRVVVPPGWLETQAMVVKPSKWDSLVEGKNLLIIGEDPAAYLHAYPATPYLDWDLSRKHLENPGAFENLSAIYRNFSEDTPDVIIDQKGLVPDLFRQMPTIASRYRRQGDSYVLQSNN